MIRHSIKSCSVSSVAIACTLAVVLSACPGLITAQETSVKFSSDQIDFFETKIRPLFSSHCLECHGAVKSESGLRLDSRSAILKGGSSGPAAVSGLPGKSLMIEAVNHTGDYDMPPNKKLSDSEISDMNRWVKMGLPWPSKTTISKRTMPELRVEHRQNHWAFQKIEKPTIKPRGDSKPESSPVDQLITAKLQTIRLAQSPRADRRTLIRRATFDLIGLPPTFEEVQDFVNDESPDAYEKLIDRLLESPHYGERWARHWLDVARYSDTSGYKADAANNRFPFAFTYRDYVIDAFNKDLPYDQFIRQQLAADHLEIPEDNKTLAALGFITVGRQYTNKIDTYDDQVDVVTRGLMGLTVSCARCHDHKYDAIPTEDYYSLFSVFSNNSVPDELPILGDENEQAKFADFFRKLDEKKNELESFNDAKLKEIRKHVRSHFHDYIARVMLLQPHAPEQLKLLGEQPFIKLEFANVRQEVLVRWRDYLAFRINESPKFIKPLTELVALPDQDFAANSKKLIDRWAANPDAVNRLLLQRLKANPPTHKIELAKICGDLLQEIYEFWESKGAIEPPIGQFNAPDQVAQKEIADVVFGKGSPVMLNRRRLPKYFNVLEKKEVVKFQSAIKAQDDNAPEGFARAMVLKDNPRLHEETVMIRGNEDIRGVQVPRRFVSLLTPSEERRVFKTKSGRLDLADKIASRDNPLTARVFVNRVWMHHFGNPLVDTPSDFGIRCEPPIQRELLDYLAFDFMENGWSIKHLHRRIMNSETYCQTSKSRSECSSVDPENRMLWRMNRRRLEFESLRDSMLAVSGNLDRKFYGKPIDLLGRPFANRRTIYGFIDRQDLQSLYRVFDFASPDQSAAKRVRTSVPQQSLFMMNSRFVLEQSQLLVNRIPDIENKTRQQRIKHLYRFVLQRDPDEDEMKLGEGFISSASEGEQQAGKWQRYAQALLMTNEFEFVD
ncbi:MAG: PSD1 and planctomycete cytochrome C domain-containing protein [Mariniblastus sp.]